MQCINDLMAQRCLFCRDIDSGNGGNKLEAVALGVLRMRIDTLKTLFEAEQMDDNAESCKQTLEILATVRHVDVSGARAYLDGLVARIQTDFKKRVFIRVGKGMSDFVDKGIVLGRDVAVAFPLAVPDITEAGNCLAVECNTAAVFHLMRVSEYGLRSLAKTLRVRLTHKGKIQPIEFADWNKIITECKNKIAKSRTLSPGPKRQGQLNRLSEAADHCEYMKDIWRNDLSHARKPYSHHDAMGVFERVRSFMIFLASGQNK